MIDRLPTNCHVHSVPPKIIDFEKLNMYKIPQYKPLCPVYLQDKEEIVAVKTPAYTMPSIAVKLSVNTFNFVFINPS